MNFLPNTSRLRSSARRNGLLLAVAASIAGTPALTTAPALAASSGPGVGEILELRGYAKIGDAYEFSIYNRETERGEWLREGETRDGYSLEAFDPETNRVTIRYRGESATISLQRSRIAQYDPPATSPRPGYVPLNPPPERRPEGRPGPERGAAESVRPAPAPEPGAGGQEDPAGSEEAPSFLTGGTGGARTGPPGSDPGSPPSAGAPPGETDPEDEDDPGDPSDTDDLPPPDPDTPPPAYTPDQ